MPIHLFVNLLLPRKSTVPIKLNICIQCTVGNIHRSIPVSMYFFVLEFMSTVTTKSINTLLPFTKRKGYIFTNISKLIRCCVFEKKTTKYKVLHKEIPQTGLQEVE